MNILFSCAGRRNYLINYFKEALNNDGLIIATDADATAPSLKDADLGLTVPLINDPNYFNAIKDIVIKHKVDAIISLNDLELPLLTKNKKDLEKANVKVLISSEDVISIAFDKYKTFKFIESIGLNAPKTFCSLPLALEAIKKGELTFPLVLKPRWGTASIGIEFPETLEELHLIYKLWQIKLKKTIIGDISETDFENAILIQEKMKGQEYGMDVVNDFDCNYFGTFARKKILMRAGETDVAESVINENIINAGKIIGENLKHLGTMDCDVFLVDDKLYLLEMNPRFGGGYPFSHEAGVNTAALYIEWLKGNKKVDHLVNYKGGIIYSKCSRLLRISK